MHALAQKLALVFCGGIWLPAAWAQNHFQCVSPTNQSYSIVVTAAAINNTSLKAGDEIGVFTSAGLCVGAAKLPPLTNIPLAAWKDDPQTSQVDGYVPGDTMRFKVWNSKAQIELVAKPVYQSGNGTFEGGLFAIVSLSATVITEVKNAALAALPSNFVLHQNYPNPFNPSTAIRYALAKPGDVTLKVFNLLGKEMATLVSRKQPAGEYEIRWHPNGLPSGVYAYRLQASGFVETRKLILAK